ncbi:MAG: malate dehydrogenase [Methanomicrobiales archaeon]|nr:malate dehydrogenase [Methanomicrobiales archaeon]
MAKVAIFGATGRLGSYTVHAVSHIPHVSEILILGRKGREDYLEGLARDYIESFAARGIDTTIDWSTDLEAAERSAVVVCTAGNPRTPDRTRLELAYENAMVVAPFARQLLEIAPRSILLMVTNPVDVMTSVALHYSGFRMERIFGLGTHLDSMRLKALIAEKLNVHVSEVHTRIIGEHGDSMVPLWSATSIGGIPIKNLELASRLDLPRLVEQVKISGEVIIRKKGSTVYGPGEAIATLVRTVLANENRILTVTSHADGEIHGIGDVCIGIPARINRKGIYPVSIHLEEQEMEAFTESANKIRACTRQVMERLGARK